MTLIRKVPAVEITAEIKIYQRAGVGDWYITLFGDGHAPGQLEGPGCVKMDLAVFADHERGVQTIRGHPTYRGGRGGDTPSTDCTHALWISETVLPNCSSC